MWLSINLIVSFVNFKISYLLVLGPTHDGSLSASLRIQTKYVLYNSDMYTLLTKYKDLDSFSVRFSILFTTKTGKWCCFISLMADLPPSMLDAMSFVFTSASGGMNVLC